MRLVKTCDACPEQYDVFHGDRKVGYIRLRWGYLSVRFPDSDGKEVYSAEIGEDHMDGMFRSEEEREHHLSLAKDAIRKELKLL